MHSSVQSGGKILSGARRYATGMAGERNASKGVPIEMTSHIKLYGSKADRFEMIKSDMTSRFGYEPSNPEVLGYLMANYDTDGVWEGALDEQPRNPADDD